MKIEQIKKYILKNASQSAGRTAYLKYLNGNKITRNQAIIAKCFDCSGYYIDGRDNCKIESCPLWPYRPYQKIDSKDAK